MTGLGEPCESCGVNVVAPFARDGGRILLEMPHRDGRTQQMPRHTPKRCQQRRADALDADPR